jgi:dTDP-4-amino-4,6-dideoxygalactose transaminase
VAASPPPRIPLIDLKAQFRSIRDEIMGCVENAFENQQFILGPEVEKLESELADYCGVRHAIGCASGSDALYLALLALDLKPGDQVITVPYTFFATAGAIVKAGGEPVFVDIEPSAFNMDPAKLAEALERHRGVRAIMPVHLFGACAEMDPILELAERHGVPVIEDAAQAIGAEDRGRRAGSMGKIGCFSFFPTKNLGGCGDGGFLTTNDPAVAERLKALRVHGSKRRYYHEEVGVNSRLDSLNAAVLRVKLRHLDEWTSGRQRNAGLYRELLASAGEGIVLPGIPQSCSRHVWNQFVIRTSQREELRAWLDEAGVGTDMYYPLPLHLQTCFLYLGYGVGEFPVSEECARSCLALPIFPELGQEGVRRVAGRILEFGKRAGG